MEPYSLQAGLNSVFTFSWTCCTKIYRAQSALPFAYDRKDGVVPFSWVLAVVNVTAFQFLISNIILYTEHTSLIKSCCFQSEFKKLAPEIYCWFAENLMNVRLNFSRLFGSGLNKLWKGKLFVDTSLNIHSWNLCWTNNLGRELLAYKVKI